MDSFLTKLLNFRDNLGEQYVQPCKSLVWLSREKGTKESMEKRQELSTTVA